VVLREYSQMQQRIHEICRSFNVQGQVQRIDLPLVDVTVLLARHACYYLFI